MLAPASHGSHSSGSPNLTSSAAEVDIDSFSQTRASNLDFESSSFDISTAVVEAQTSEDFPSPDSQANIHPTTEPNSSHSNYCETYPSDLFASLNSTFLTPPPSDQARHQSLRFPTDLYTPSYIRNRGVEREGWCGICRPGRWLKLKSSAFWYDKSFRHGISAASGMRFDHPMEVRKTAEKAEGEGKEFGQGDEWEGLCGTCGVWLALGGGSRPGVPWFRHAFKVSLSILKRSS